MAVEYTTTQTSTGVFSDFSSLLNILLNLIADHTDWVVETAATDYAGGRATFGVCHHTPSGARICMAWSDDSTASNVFIHADNDFQSTNRTVTLHERTLWVAYLPSGVGAPGSADPSVSGFIPAGGLPFTWWLTDFENTFQDLDNRWHVITDSDFIILIYDDNRAASTHSRMVMAGDIISATVHPGDTFTNALLVWRDSLELPETSGNFHGVCLDAAGARITGSHYLSARTEQLGTNIVRNGEPYYGASPCLLYKNAPGATATNGVKGFIDPNRLLRAWEALPRKHPIRSSTMIHLQSGICVQWAPGLPPIP